MHDCVSKVVVVVVVNVVVVFVVIPIVAVNHLFTLFYYRVLFIRV